MEKPTLSRNAKVGLFLVLISFTLIYLLRDVVVPVAFSFLLAYFLDPLVDRLEERKLSRTTGIFILLFVILVLASIAMLIFIPLIENEISRFIARLPKLLATLQTTLNERLAPWLEELTGLGIQALAVELSARVADLVNNLNASDIAPLTEFLAKTFSGTYAAVMAIVSAALIPIFTFYFLRDFDTIKLEPLEYVPPRHRETVVRLFSEIDITLASFVRGQLTVCLILGVLYGLGFAISGVPLGLLIGLLAGILAFIPYFGAIFGVSVSLILILLDWQGFGPLIGLGCTFGIVQTLDSVLITPKIVGGKVGLSPVAVIISLLVGGKLLGFAGVLVAVPAAAVLNILRRHLKEHYQQTAFYKGG